MKGSKVASDQTIANIPGKDDKGLSYNGKDRNEKAEFQETQRERPG